MRSSFPAIVSLLLSLIVLVSLFWFLHQKKKNSFDIIIIWSDWFFSFSVCILVQFGYVMEMEAGELGPGDYWKNVMHNQPIPKSIAELLTINEEFSSSISDQSHHHHHHHHNFSMIKHEKKKIQSPAPATLSAASNETLNGKLRFSRTFDTSPNVIIYHSSVIINWVVESVVYNLLFR